MGNRGGSIVENSRADWMTPPALFADVHEAFGFDVDLCAHADNARLPAYIDEATDAFMVRWADYGRVGWLNPPYGPPLEQWLLKAHEAAAVDGFVTLSLIPFTSEAPWWHRTVMQHAAEVWAIEGRVRFWEPGPDGMWKPGGNPRFASAFALWAPKPRHLRQAPPAFRSYKRPGGA